MALELNQNIALMLRTVKLTSQLNQVALELNQNIALMLRTVEPALSQPHTEVVLEQGAATGAVNTERQRAPARPSGSAALAKRRGRRRRRLGSCASSGDSSGDTSEDNDDTPPGAPAPSAPTKPTDALPGVGGGGESAPPPPPLLAAPVEGAGQGQLLLLGKKRISERRLHVGSHAWHKRMDQKGVDVRRIFSIVDVRRIFQSWKELTRSRLALQTVMAFQHGVSSFTSRQNTQYVL